MGKIIGLTYDAKEDWPVGPGQPADTNAEFDPQDTIEDIVGALKSAGHKVKKIGNVKSLLAQIDNLGVDIVFNISEGLCGRNRESQVPIILELFNIPYIGSDALALGLTLDKMMSKKCFLADNIVTPKFFIATSCKNLEKMNNIGFPLMVKPCYEGTSKGITELSRVEDYESLCRQVRLINETYRQPALVEEFIRGKELTVVVLGNESPEAMPVVQYSINNQLDLGDEFYTFDLVVAESVEYFCPAQISEELTRRLQKIAVEAYNSVGCRDFGRVDFRVDKDNNPYVLEINPLPCLAKKDTFSFVAQASGKIYEEMILRVLDEGLKRLNMSSQKVEVGA